MSIDARKRISTLAPHAARTRVYELAGSLAGAGIFTVLAVIALARHQGTDALLFVVLCIQSLILFELSYAHLPRLTVTVPTVLSENTADRIFGEDARRQMQRAQAPRRDTADGTGAGD